ncbi:hypothetical protein ACFL0W_03015 [Nanoarchaeota archaeon]
MAVLTDVFAKRTQQPSVDGRAPKPLPTQQVLQFRQQGWSDNQVIEALQRDGYSSGEISSAINQADLKGSVEAADLKKGDKMEPTMDIQDTQGQAALMQAQQGQMPPMGAPPPAAAPPGPAPAGAPGMPQPQEFLPPENTTEAIHEVAESIIDEKWTELTDNIKRILDWKDKVEAKIGAIDQQFSDLKGSFDKLHEGVLAKVGEYDKNITNVGTEIKALEKVFQKVLPSLTESVSELAHITEEMKKNK